MTSGIHHVTSITADVQANVDFYAGFLGLRLVKRTAGFEDGEQLHLFYGDDLGSPGTLLSFLVWQDAGRGRTGLGQVSEIGLAIAPDEIGQWMTRAMQAQVPFEGPSREFGETVLRLKDPDGMIVKLVGVAMQTPAPRAGAPIRIRGVTILSETPQQTADFIARFGYRPGPVAGPVQRLVSDTDIVDVRGAAGFVPSIQGAGVADHVAFRAPDLDALRAMRVSLKDHGPTTVHDRVYFMAMYVREPGNTLIEYATDGPGMLVDESADQLGQRLMIPPHDLPREEELRVMLPSFALPGEARLPMRELPFIHRIHCPEGVDGSTMVLLHGTGGNETDLMPIAHRIAPDAMLIGVRGRSTEEGVNRWFRRFDAVTYDQDDIRAEAEAFAAFVEGAVRGYGLDPARIIFMGYSNGANLLGAAMQLHPGLVRRAILLRAVQTLETPGEARNPGARVLMLDGASDMFGRMAPALARALGAGGADVEVRRIEAGHDLVHADMTEARAWLDAG